MHKIALVILGVFSLALFGADLRADDRFPSFNLMPGKVSFGNSSSIVSECQFFAAGEGVVQTIASGFSGNTARATPYQTITELLAGFQRNDVTKIVSLYTGSARKEQQGFLTDPNDGPGLLRLMATYTSFEIVCAVRDPGTNDVMTIVLMTHGGKTDVWAMLLTNVSMPGTDPVYLFKGDDPSDAIQQLTTFYVSNPDARGKVSFTPR